MDEEIREEFTRIRDNLHDIRNETFPKVQSDVLEIRLAIARVEGAMLPLSKTWDAIQQLTILVATVDKLASAHEIRLRAVEKIVWGAVMGILATVGGALLAGIIWFAKAPKP